MKQPTLQQFKRFAKQNASLAYAVAVAQAFAQCERERVDAYIEPMFQSFSFHARADWGGDLLTKAKQAYLCGDEAGIAKFYAEADKLHRIHGFKGEAGYCPALVAEEIQRKAERAILEAGSEFLGVDFANTYGETRKKALDLLMGACLKARAEKQAA